MAADHPARFLRGFVDQLDLAALGFAMPIAVEGRPPHPPSLLLKIWLYGDYHRIRAARKLKAAWERVFAVTSALSDSRPTCLPWPSLKCDQKPFETNSE